MHPLMMTVEYNERMVRMAVVFGVVCTDSNNVPRHHLFGACFHWKSQAPLQITASHQLRAKRTGKDRRISYLW
jgi:hypothetical protein